MSVTRGRTFSATLSVFVLVLASVVTPTGSAWAQPAGFPTLEFAQGCRNTAAGNKTTLDRCMRAEQKAWGKLSAQWNNYRRGDRTECTALAKMGTVLQSYVELITCLEMAKDARALPKSAKE